MINIKEKLNKEEYKFFLDKSFLGSIDDNKSIVVYQEFLKKSLPRFKRNVIVYDKIKHLISQDKEFLVILKD